MTERDAQTIRYMAQKGATQKTIAKVYGVNPRKIRRVLNGEDLEIRSRAKPADDAGRDRHPNGTVRRNPQAVSRLLKETTRPAVTSWRPATCQYIAGDGRKDEDKCGTPVQEGSSYCPEHHRRCWVKPWQKKGEKE